MAGLLDRMGQGGAARAHIYGGARQALGSVPSTPLLCVAFFADIAGTVNAAGALVLASGAESAIILPGTPTWARIYSGNMDHLFDCDVRLSSAADAGQELVVYAVTLYAGALVRILSGSFSATA